MNKRQYFSIICILAFFGLAAGLEFFFTKEQNLANYERRIESTLHQNEQEITAIWEDKGFIGRKFKVVKDTTNQFSKSDLELLKNLSIRPYNLCLYKKDSLIFWTNNQAFPTDALLEKVNKLESDNDLVLLPNGYYEYIYQSFSSICEDCFGLGLIPIKNEYSLESEYLKNTFITDNGNSIPEEVVISKVKTPFVVNSGNEKVLLYLDAHQDIKDKSQLKLLLFVYLMGFLSIGFLVNDLAILLVKRYRPWIGAFFLVGVVFGVRFLTVQFGLTANFSDLHTFSETFDTPVLNSTSTLGDLLINIVLLLWMMVFFHREFQVKKFENVSTPIRYGLTSLNYFSIILGILMITGVFKSLVIDSDITFDFDNVFNLNFYSFLAILGIILLLFALFLFSHRMMSTIVQIGLSKHQRLISLGIASVASIPIILLADLMLPVPQMLLVALIYIGLFDLFIDNEEANLTWLVTWLVIFAAFSSILLFKYNADKDFQLRNYYAQELSNFRDSIAESSFSKLRLDIQQDDFLLSLTSTEGEPEEKAFFNEIDLQFSDNKYLLQNYAYEFSAFYKEDSSEVFTNQKDSLFFVYDKFYQAEQTAHNGLKFWEGKESNYAYLMKLEIGNENPITGFFEFKRKTSNPSKVYTELLLDQQYKGLTKLFQYDYAIYKEGNLINESGGKVDHDKRISTESLPEVGSSKKIKSTSTRWELLYHAPNNIVVFIGRTMGGYIKPISLFSYLFGLLVIISIILAFINSFTNALPTALNFAITKRPSLRNRIQFSVITLILISFVMIGVVSVIHFRNETRDYHSGRLDRKAGAAKMSTQREVELMLGENPDEFDISNLVNSTSQIHRLDVNMYNTNGDLITSSEPNIFRKKILAPKMGAFAFFSFPEKSGDNIVQDEMVGSLPYKSAYVPIEDKEGKILGYMGLPYYSQLRDLSGDVDPFMGTLLNVYVFLLLIAAAIAIAVANSITRPISDLGDSLKRLKLGSKNEPLEWSSKDELGDLITEYNRTIQELEESTKKLAQSEREVAWREMAKQVAHEIKNPLTPMKLSIQYLMHAYQSNPSNIEPLMSRVSKTLIEQIDSLSQIASEFSNFAKMPAAESTKFILNDLTASVHSLFGNERQDMEVNLYMPDKQFYVYGDKNHLTRVLNNLIKNAIQAIPDDRTGKIDVTLFRENEELVVIKVTDNGTGISDEMKDKVFVPNFTTKNSGTGLGLAISKNIIENFNGNIYFETKVNVGTSFFVELPLIEVKELQEV